MCCIARRFVPVPSPLLSAYAFSLLLPDRVTRGVQVGHATAYPEVRKYRVGLAADQARRPVLRTESCGPLADFVNLWPLIGQITRGDQRSDVSLKLPVAQCHFFAAASISARMIASRLRSDLMALSLSFSASSRRSSRVRASLTWSGTADGLARRATASLAAAAGSRTVDSRFLGVAARGSSGWLVPERSGRARRLDTRPPALH